MISGGAFQFGLAGLYSDPDKPSHTGHMMIVVDPEIAMGRDALAKRMSEYYATIKKSPMWEPSKEMMVPGELEHRTRLARERDGIPLPSELIGDLEALRREHGVQARLG